MSYRRLHSQSSTNSESQEEKKKEKKEKLQVPDLIERYKAAFVLSGSCGSLSFRNGDWEGITEGILIQGHINDILGGIENLEVSSPPWRLPEEVIMHLATTNALLELDRNVQDDATVRQSLQKWICRGGEEISARRHLLALEKIEGGGGGGGEGGGGGGEAGEISTQTLTSSEQLTSSLGLMSTSVLASSEALTLPAAVTSPGAVMSPTAVTSPAAVTSPMAVTSPGTRVEAGCDAAVRCLSIGLRFPSSASTRDLVRLAIETGTRGGGKGGGGGRGGGRGGGGQSLPLDFLGGVATAFFASAAVREEDPRSWGWKFVNEILPLAKKYLEDKKKSIDAKSWRHFDDVWRKFLQQRGLETEQQCKKNLPRYPIKFGVKERDNFYKMMSYGGVPASSGHDAAIIAYDAILSCEGDWLELVCRGCFHGGRRSVTGVIAGALFGAVWGFRGVCRPHLDQMEHLERLVHSGQSLFAISTTTTTSMANTANEHEADGEERLV